MSMFKCKMCGGTLDISSGMTVAECQYCGTKQTLPRLDDEKKANLYDRANYFRRNGEFDKAMSIYEQILNEDNTDAEAYWSLVLGRYGIEYVEDPMTHKRIPTVNRTQMISIFVDEDYKSALKYADGYQRGVYEAEARAIDEIQKGILNISRQEEPFDVFICYKEKDKMGRRTQDSVLANDLYHQLTEEGFKVFFARITLENKLGTAYEPYIFAALNSAKVMVVLGTKPEYFKAVWVKNEWFRYLTMIRNGAKKMLIPAYKDMNPYDLPEEFSHLQALDMSQIGFLQDLIRGIKKVVEKEAPQQESQNTAPASPNSANVSPLLKRAFLFLEDGDWHSANEYCEKVLDMEPENAMAYLGKLMAAYQVSKQEGLANCKISFEEDKNYQKILRFGDQRLKQLVEGYVQQINERNEHNRKQGVYQGAIFRMEHALREQDYREAARQFELVPGFEDANERKQQCLVKAEQIKCREQAHKKRKKKILSILVFATIFSIIMIFVAFYYYFRVVIPRKHNEWNYQWAMEAMESENYDKAVSILEKLKKYKDGEKQLELAMKKRKEKRRQELCEAEIGDNVYFGEYKEDAILGKGKEQIEWLVLDKKENKVLLLSKYCLDEQPFCDTESESAVWKDSYIRTWLNETFLEEAFDEGERKAISTEKVRSYYVTYSDLKEDQKKVKDKVFLFDEEEVDKYLTETSDRQAEISGGDYYKYMKCEWMLRSTGDNGKAFQYINFWGDLQVSKDLTSLSGIRPALWLNLDKLP